MTSGQVINFLLFAVVAAITPGPSNLILTSTGANVGLLRGLPCLGGVVIGMGLMMFLVAFGLGNVVLASPGLILILKWGGIGFLLWLSWKIATAGRSDATTDKQPLGFGVQPLFNGSTLSRGSSVSARLASTCTLQQAQHSPRRWALVCCLCLPLCRVVSSG